MLPKIFCLMKSGDHPVTKQIGDLLLTNAHDMYEQRATSRRIINNYCEGIDGFINSDLEILETEIAGRCIELQATFSTRRYDLNQVDFLVRIEDLEGFEKCRWAKVLPFQVPPGYQGFVMEIEDDE